MEYELKAEDIGNSAVSEDNTNKPQNDYMEVIVFMVIVIERVMVKIIVMVTPQEMMGVMLQVATAVMLRLLTIMMGCNS